MEENKPPNLSAGSSKNSILPKEKEKTAAVDSQAQGVPKTAPGKPVKAVWLQPSPVAPNPHVGYTQPDPAKPRGERYILPDKYKVSRSVSPVWGNRQYRYPKQDATISTRFVCLLLNYLQRTELPENEIAKNTLHQFQSFSRFTQPTDERAILHVNLMKADQPRFLGGCQELLEVMRLNTIEHLSAIEVNITCSRNCRRDDELQEYWIIYRVLVYVKILTDNGTGEHVLLKDPEGKDIVYTIQVDYSWETSIDNFDKMAWKDIVEELRNKAKCMYDGFGHIRSEEDHEDVKQKLLPDLSPFQKDMRAKYGVDS